MNDFTKQSIVYYENECTINIDLYCLDGSLLSCMSMHNFEDEICYLGCAK